MRTAIFTFLISVNLVFAQSSVLIEPNATNGILSKNNSAVTLPMAQPMALPDSGAGTRLMWIPNQSVLRAGTVTGDQWNRLNVGRWSFATGYNTEARADYSSSLGLNTIAQNKFSTIVGRNNIPVGGTVGELDWTYHLFAVGNGFSPEARNNAFTVTYDGSIGINTAKPYYPLTFKSVLGDKISFWGGDDTVSEPNHFGIGIQDYTFQFFTPTSDNDFVFGTGRSYSFNEKLRIQGNGRVGIGLNNPNHILDVNGRIRIRHITGETAGIWMSNSTNSLSNADGAFFGMRDDASAGIWIGNNWRFWVNNAGRANADGGLVVGSGGSPINKINKLSFNHDMDELFAGAILTVNFNAPGVSSSDVIIMTPNQPISDLIVMQVIAQDNAIKVMFKNDSNASRNPPLITYNFLVFK
ncbi:MAG: hypothetical protein ACK4NY_20285 [Spirosomataceae bacterium]